VAVGLVRDLACVMEFGVVGRWGKCFYIYMRIVIGRFMVSFMCVEHLCTIYTYLYICKNESSPRGYLGS